MSRLETLRSLGIEPAVVPAHNPMDGINAVRRLLDRAVIDPVRCPDGLDLLRNYKYEWQERKRVWSPHPGMTSPAIAPMRCAPLPPATIRMRRRSGRASGVLIHSR